ncbi:MULTISPECIES: NUDIX hydrolase [unclassified Butyrivibrio]|uniref:NUDIX hydrolase n=1 Tax=unclassified Butyrivibrio TaxID=2639466 RepID=UPI0003FED436|nr:MULTISPECIES: 8-oxo-dGTP diphosphatase [unclassified Butyrivibrio]SEL48379.1 8-oxo-dGTP diphosphatase [Butyrivibrio sp. ob235]
MEITTLCYMERDGKYLMLHRIKKKNDINEGKWIAPGGHCENGESPDDCVKREVLEETGIKLNSLKFRGIVTFYSRAVAGNRDGLYEPSEAENGDVTDYMCLFTSDDFEGDAGDCNEGVLEWISKDELVKLDLWKGDLIFLDLIKDPAQPFFSLKLTYEGDELVEAVLDGKLLNI